MHLRRLIVAVSVAALMALAGCGKSDSTADATRSAAPTNTSEAQPVAKPSGSGDLVARLHWIGKKQLAAESNATNFMSIWNMPESVALEAQTLDKLSLAPWRLTKGNAATNGAPTAQLRTLLDDLVQAESYLEIRRASNQPGQIVLAVRLDAERARLWETNLAAVLESLTDLHVSAGAGAGWSLKKHDTPNLAQLVRAGDWTLVGLAQERNDLLADLQTRIEHDHAPFPKRETNYWVEADGDIAGLRDVFSFGLNLPTNTPKFTLAFIGDGENVRMRGEFKFAWPLDVQLEPWNIPTNLIHEPLVSFTAARGIKPLLAESAAWQSLHLSNAPNQFFAWALGANVPFQTYFAAPLESASNHVAQIGDWLVKQNAAFSPNGRIGRLEVQEGKGIRWAGVPFLMPHLTHVTIGEQEFVRGGFFPSSPAGSPIPVELMYAIYSRTNLVYYGWEYTKARVEGWTGIGQVIRLSSRKARMSQSSPSMTWLRVTKTNLANCATSLVFDEPNKLIFTRNSTVGFSGIELHVIADWLESPEFPWGFHTQLAPPEVFGRPQTNVVNSITTNTPAKN